LSENIRVLSIVGRFLEHSRIFYFRNGSDDPTDGEFFIGSADWMYRNLQNRVEAVTPVEDRPLRERLWQGIQVMLGDRRQAWEMDADGNYRQRLVVDPALDVGTQRRLMALAQNRWRSPSSPPDGDPPTQLHS
jgi:polyphosphate kinase